MRRLVKHGVEVWVQNSRKRAFLDEEYAEAGANLCDDLKACPVIFGVKEIPLSALEPRKTYAFFSHTVKGQKASMPLLERILALKSRLIDYEKIVDENGRRLVFFGKYAGIAGMIDSLWALGQRLKMEGFDTPFATIKQANQYGDLNEAMSVVTWAGDRIRRDGLPEQLAPLICGFSGRGNVSRGAQLVYDRLPVELIPPEGLPEGHLPRSRHKVYKWALPLNHLMEHKDRSQEFSYSDYHAHPENYRSTLNRHLPKLMLFINGIFWDRRYPRLITKDLIKKMYSRDTPPRLRVIGDITCDVDGSVECNVRATDTGDPVYVYDPRTDRTKSGVRGRGPVVMAVDNLPCELPRESSTEFSGYLYPFALAIARADYSKSFAASGLPKAVVNAIVGYGGALPPRFTYLKEFMRPEAVGRLDRRTAPRRKRGSERR